MGARVTRTGVDVGVAVGAGVSTMRYSLKGWSPFPQKYESSLVLVQVVPRIGTGKSGLRQYVLTTHPDS